MTGNTSGVSATMPASSPPLLLQPLSSTAPIPSEQRILLFMTPSSFSCTSPWIDGSPAVLGSFVASPAAAWRKRGPVALRHQLWLILPLSRRRFCFIGRRCQFWDVLKTGVSLSFDVGNVNDRFGSVAVVETHSSRMTAFRGKADFRPG